MTAQAVVDVHWDMASIIGAAGGDIALARFERDESTPQGGTLFVPGVDQAVLDVVVAGYDDGNRTKIVTLALVNRLRDTKLAAGYADAVTAKTYQTDDASISRLDALGCSAGFAVVMSVPRSFDLIAADNTVTTLPAAQMFALLNQRVMPWVSATRLYARALKNQVLAGQTIDINAGWPT